MTSRFSMQKLLALCTHPAVKTMVTLGLLLMLFNIVDVAMVWQRLQQLDPLFLLAAIVCLLVGYGVCGLRWAWIASGLGIAVSRRRKIRLYFLGMFTSLFLPSTIGGDVVRGILLAKGEARSGLGVQATASVILDRVNGLIALVTLLTLCMLWFSWPLYWWLLWLTGMALTWSAMLAYPWLHRQLTRHVSFLQQLPLQTARFQRQWWRSLPISLLFQLLIIQAHVFLGMAVGLEMSWPAYAMTMGLIALVAILPISFNGFGIREAGYVGLASYFGGNADAAAAMAALWVIVLAVSALPGAWVLWRLGGVRSLRKG